jgi:hypothetical protein
MWFFSRKYRRKIYTPDRIRTCDLRFRKPPTEDDKSLQINSLDAQQDSAYKPAYKNIPENAEKQAQNLPDDLALIAVAWPELPEHIKAAIMALIKTAKH